MAKRGRVPRHKSHTPNRNKNPKLSPYQRELRRDKLANQPPTAKTMWKEDEIPRSQRELIQFLAKQEERREARKKLMKEREMGLQEDIAQEEGPKKRAREEETADAPAESTTVAKTEPTTEQKKKHKPVFASLNESFAAELAPPKFGESKKHDAAAVVDPSKPRTTEEIIAAKKEKKHRRKQELRQQKKNEEFSQIDTQLKELLDRSSKKKKVALKSQEVEYEKQLVKMQKEKAREDKAKLAEERKKELSAAKKKRNAPPREDTEFKIASEEKPQKKRISFDTAEGEDTTEEHHAMRYPGDTKKKVKDFYELVDVVRFGERVEAPPVFDVVPNKNAAVTKLAAKLEREALTAGKQTTRVGLRKPADASSGGASRRLNNSIENERTWLLSGGGKAGEHKRLARLGLAPAATQHNNVNHAEEVRKLTKEKEMQLLRQSVMATYQRNRSKEVQSKKGVDMKHEFPRFE